MTALQLPLKDAAEFLGVSVDTVRRRLRRGELSGEFVDGKWVVEVQEPVVDGAGSLSPMSQFALKVLNDRVTALEDENRRLLTIIERLTASEESSSPRP